MASVPVTPASSVTRTSRSARRSAAAPSPSGSSPTRLSRVQEKEELRQLNDRLAAYIERVRQLESDKCSMQLLLEEKEESSSREAGKLRSLYESELADARKMLDTTASERARLEIELSQLAEDHRRLQARNNKKEAELTTAVGHWRNLEAALNTKEADFANLLAENRRLEKEISELKVHVSNLESGIQDAKTQLHTEMLRRVDLENQVQTLREQMDFQKHLGEQELKEMRSRHEMRLVEVDSGRQKEFESKLGEAMQQLRQEHEVQIHQYKEELERTFSAKAMLKEFESRCLDVEDEERKESLREERASAGDELQELDNAHHTAATNNDLANLTREELAGTRQRLESVTSQLSHSQKQNGTLETRLRDLEDLLDREQRTSQRRLTEKEREMAEVRQQMQGQLEEYENLLDVKLALDMEINAYRKMLEGEEQRLHLSPSPAQQGPIPRTHMQATRRMRGKKRRLESRASGSPAYKISQQASAQGSVSVDEIDLDGNYVKLRNNSDRDQALGGWILRKSQRSGSQIAFQIPSSYILPAGQTLTIWGSSAGVEPSPPTDLVWNQRSWGEVDDVRVVLENPQSEETAERRLVRTPRGGEGDSDVEFEGEAGSEMLLCRQPKRRKKKCCAVS